MGQTTWTDELLDVKRRVGDPLADRVVEQIFTTGEADAVGSLLRTLVRNDQLPPSEFPPEVRAYLAETLALPAWANQTQIEAAEQFFQRWGMLMSMTLLCASLPSSYAARKGVQVLHRTARLESDPKRRILETAQLLIDVMTPGGLLPGGDGIRTIQKVRLMHAAIRHLIREQAKQTPGFWDDAWGVPINQEDLAGTLLTFSAVVLASLQKLEIAFAPAEAEAHLHCWNVVGHLLGVDDDLLAHDLGEAASLLNLIQERQFGACAEGVAMTRALVEMLNGLCPLPVLAGVPAAMIAHLVGDETAALIGLTPSHESHRGFAAFLHLGDFIDRELGRHQVLARLAEPLSRAILENAPLVPRGGNRGPFYIPTSLGSAWKLAAPPAVAAQSSRFDALAAQARPQPDPAPTRPWIMAQHWEQLFFAHWPLPVEDLRHAVPAGFEIETFEGMAWLSIVAMRLDHAHFRHLLPLPNLRLSPELQLSNFPELNFRTYVRCGERSGVYFFSLDTPSAIVVQLARHLFSLPYAHADIQMAAGENGIEFTSSRRDSSLPPAELSCRYRAIGEPLTLVPGSLDAFLTDRSVMFTLASDGILRYGEVHHPPWVLQAAEGEFEVNTLPEAIAVPNLPGLPRLRYARETDVFAWPMERISSPAVAS